MFLFVFSFPLVSLSFTFFFKTKIQSPRVCNLLPCFPSPDSTHSIEITESNRRAEFRIDNQPNYQDWTGNTGRNRRSLSDTETEFVESIKRPRVISHLHTTDSQLI